MKTPKAQGLYDPQNEHDNCGIGLIVDMKGRRSHSIVRDALEICENLDHRGGCGCDPITGDGAGIFIQIPDRFFRTVCEFEIPDEGDYGAGFIYLSQDKDIRSKEITTLEQVAVEEGLDFIGWRDVPVKSDILGKASRECEPVCRQFFVGRGKDVSPGLDFERKLYLLRRVASYRLHYGLQDTADAPDFHIVSLSSRTMTYKGMLTTWQLDEYFPDLSHPDMESALALTHSRFSTNTFPSWHRAQPFRYLCHNGEINTVRGNENWLYARQMQLASKVFGDDLKKLLPIIRADGSDSQKFDNCLEFLVLSGRSLAHSMMMMIPEPWERHQSMPEYKKEFYEFHACLMEPWDGPASIAVSDGVQIGAVLDRNGLRPSRYYVTADDRVILASEVGVLAGIQSDNIVKKGRLKPGRMFLVDMEQGRIIDDGELKKAVASEAPYGKWLKDNLIKAASLPDAGTVQPDEPDTLLKRQQAFGYTYEDLRFIIGPSADSGKQPLGSMGNDAPLAVLSDNNQIIYNYFKQLFAQVTNPPIDPIREELVTASVSFVGTEGDLSSPGPRSCRMIRHESPLIDDSQLERLRGIALDGFQAKSLPILFNPNTDDSAKALTNALEELFAAADTAIKNGDNIIILSDREVDENKGAIPALLAVAGLHHHLIRQGTRTRVSIILESGEPREVMHYALLIGYGANLINPYLALETVRHLCTDGVLAVEDPAIACTNFLKANLGGVIKTMSKMGISTVASYRGAQIFEAIGLNQSIIDQYFTATSSRVEGIGMEAIAEDARTRHHNAFAPRDDEKDQPLDPGGIYQWRAKGERHLFSPTSIHKLQKATRLGSFELFREYSEEINNQSKEMFTLRGLMEFKADSISIPLDEVEPASEIVKRFKTGAMSYGSISKEAHEALAIAMNRLGGKSNTGEGGEDIDRFTMDPNGDSRRSAIKQVASGRFGVTSFYLVNSDEIQIKIVQGAKPGEGGELPGHKVLPPIAKTRGTTPGVGLISPPPHHDIYSIEDLAELIHDLKNSNHHARINVKLVSEVGVGTIAAGVAKAKADVILVSGFDGGTGASPRSSIQHAGAPWELGLAETNQTLLLNDLRSRVIVETDGQLKTGRDVAIACLLGAEEFGFATAPLVTLGCLMMRVCHKNTCPVGVATQNPELRKKFAGSADSVVNYMTYVAEEIREIMAQLGFRSINEMVGRSDKLEMRQAVDHWKAQGLDYSKILYRPKVEAEVGTYCQIKQDHLLERALDNKEILKLARPALESRQPVEINLPIINTDRVVGTITGAEVSRKHGPNGLPEDTIKINLSGSAGQSLGAFMPRGMTITVKGDTNDYCGKGLSGGKIIVRPPEDSPFVAEENIITGNVCFYGATAGEAYISGVAGERFCVRNSGVDAVIEGIGDHGCEYMTGGQIICLGDTGRNFGAGMSGGVAYILDEEGDFVSKRLNAEMVNVYPLIECNSEEIIAVRNKIEQHVVYTNSVRGQAILNDWENFKMKILKILPQDYERVLNAVSRAEERGLEGDDAIQAAFEENVKAGH
ncbi:MAG: glutamate synthase large subunit [Opitutae bacterium]|nr:glutamate synthase large subunit [Opitutae bacterium]MBT5377621.1 glutamate synthase large subunit [Opitutae bacterium]MBT5689673.1 glutamate synthase large subunit [Opitutae bacterium]MBT6461394.1 glutamate synthase large subunit [Opitutae bacterium]MBT7854746.1 glutamate synthase large subunit [Opitutae bacterium]